LTTLYIFYICTYYYVYLVVLFKQNVNKYLIIKIIYVNNINVNNLILY